jgi:RNA recognition motif-containing protein
MNGKALNSGDLLQVTTYQAPEKKPSAVSSGVSGGNPCFNNLYVKNFPRPEFTDDDLRELFFKYGEIVSAVVMKDGEGKSKGFGFVCFKEPGDAQKALSENMAR